MAFSMLKEHYCTMHIGEPVCSSWVELSYSAEGSTVEGQGREALDSSVRETRAEARWCQKENREKTLFDLSIAETIKEKGLKGLVEVK